MEKKLVSIVIPIYDIKIERKNAIICTLHHVSSSGAKYERESAKKA